MKNNHNSLAYPYQIEGLEHSEFGFTKHELGAFMIALGLVAKYTLKTPEDQQIIAKLSYELSAEIINQFS